MTRKKLMILGGSRYAVPVVEAAPSMGVHVNLPDNVAHRGIEVYCNTSVVGQDAVPAVVYQQMMKAFP